ncbi:unnamed protein product [Colias eurytheme]|nr:unnamed protein product [Colias eurytheme]
MRVGQRDGDRWSVARGDASVDRGASRLARSERVTVSQVAGSIGRSQRRHSAALSRAPPRRPAVRAPPAPRPAPAARALPALAPRRAAVCCGVTSRARLRHSLRVCRYSRSNRACFCLCVYVREFVISTLLRTSLC